MVEYLSTHTEWSHPAMGITYLLGIGGWLYYQIVSTIYSFIGTVGPAFVYEAHRGVKGCCLVSILVMWAYGRGVSFRTRKISGNADAPSGFGRPAVSVFTLMLFLDICSIGMTLGWPLAFVRRQTALVDFSVRHGHTFFLPFAFYPWWACCAGRTRSLSYSAWGDSPGMVLD